MSKTHLSAPEFDLLIESCERHSTVSNASNVKAMLSIFETMCALEEQGDDELRSIWFCLNRGSIEQFGDYDDYFESGEVENYQEFEDYWLDFYPEEKKWYSLTVSRYQEGRYFYINSQLTLECKTNKTQSDEDYPFQNQLISALKEIAEDSIAQIRKDVNAYNKFIEEQLPYKKRVGRILRKDYWAIFPEIQKEFSDSITPEILTTLEAIKNQSYSESINCLPKISSGDFFRFCEIAYDANNYFKEETRNLSPKEKYRVMADGRDCDLTSINEASNDDFAKWYSTAMNCGGHPWEICRGGNSTHISLYVGKTDKGWYLRLAGSSIVRVLETIKMAVAFHQQNIPFILDKAEEIYKIATGTDYIGIVPENVTPRYCHSYFPDEDEIIDFMNLWEEKEEQVIKKTFWYPMDEVKLK
jgi:hypothetical protein